MNSKSTIPRKTGRVRLVLECETSLAAPIEWVRLTCSIPGREGTASRVWTTPQGRLDAQAWDDLQAAVLQWMSQLLETLGGAQEKLPL